MSALSWWTKRRQLRAAARALTEEFRQAQEAGVAFGVHAKGTHGLELVAWPDSGVDTFYEAVPGAMGLDRAAHVFRRIVSLYVAGDRPPFEHQDEGVSEERLRQREALRQADAEYHRLCIDIQAPMVPDDELRLDELAAAVQALAVALEQLKRDRRA